MTKPRKPKTQRTAKGLEIPIPTKRDVFATLEKAAKPKPKPTG